MGDVLNFKCPCCGAKLTFSGKTEQMTCEYCDASFTMEQAKAAQEAEAEDAASSSMTWTTTEQLLITDENGKVSGYRCPSCCAEMVADQNTAATECPYCGNQAIIPDSFAGMYEPDCVVPFSVDKQKAKAKLQDFVKGKKLLPKSFTSNNRIDSITGLYVPFWLYSCSASGSVTYEGVKKSTREDSNFIYEKSDFYRVKRSGNMEFERIPVDASSKMDETVMESLEPYDLSKAVKYDAAYFSGYLADRYDREEKDARPRANDRVMNTFRDKMRAQVSGYDSVDAKSENIRLSDAKAEYAMLPVWMMTTKYEGKSYTFGINGQSGRMVGSLPIDKGLYWMRFALGTIIPFILIMLGVAVFGSAGITGTAAMISLIVSIIIGFIYVSILKSAMSNVHKNREATKYMNESTYKKGQPFDVFMYSKTEKRPKPKQTSGDKK
jgi:DNA-directed RNA polymerase subunit RPC12/RpoP